MPVVHSPKPAGGPAPHAAGPSGRASAASGCGPTGITPKAARLPCIRSPPEVMGCHALAAVAQLGKDWLLCRHLFQILTPLRRISHCCSSAIPQYLPHGAGSTASDFIAHLFVPRDLPLN